MTAPGTSQGAPSAGVGPAPGAPASPLPAAHAKSAFSQGWLVAVKERAYGPYPLDQLSGFLAAGSWVFHPGIEDWRIAGDVEVLKKTLALRADQEPEWWFQLKGHREQGPYSRLAMLRMVKDHAITRDTMIRHITWSQALPILETPLAESMEGDDTLHPFRQTRFTKHEVKSAPRQAFSWKIDTKEVPTWFIAASLVVGTLFFGALTWWTTTQRPAVNPAYKNADRIVPEEASLTLQSGTSATRSLRVIKTDNAGRQIQNDASAIQGGLVPVIDGKPALPGTPASGTQPHGRLVQFPSHFRDGTAEVILAPASTKSEDVLVLTQPGLAPVMVPIRYE